MSLNTDNINDVKESLNDLVQRNYEIQDDVITAIRSEDYLIAIKSIDNFVKIVDDFIKKALNMAHKFKIKSKDEGAFICLRAEKMAKHIKASHLEVEENILKKYIKKIQ